MAPRLTASNEATIAAVFAVFRGELETELVMGADEEMTSATSIRQDLLACCSNADDYDFPLPDESSEDLDAWGWILDDIVDRILWDCDYESSDGLMDLPSKAARQVRQVVGIDEEYDLVIPPDPDEGSLANARQLLTRLVRPSR